MSTTFVGRTEEQDKFKELLNNVLISQKNQYPSSSDSQEPHIFLLHGPGGMGKTTLLKRFQSISEQGHFQGNFNILFLDWEEQRKNDIGLQVGLDNIQPSTVLEVLYQALIRIGKNGEQYFKAYRQTTELLETALEKINQADEEQEEFDASTVQVDLTSQEEDLYYHSERRLAEALGKGIAKLAMVKPLIFFFDTYEIVDNTECDSVLRWVMKNSGSSVIWVIAGRANLAKSVWRNEAARSALREALKDEDPDTVAVAIKSLGRYRDEIEVPQLVGLLWHRDRYVNEAAARELGSIAETDETGVKKVLPAIEPLIRTLRNNPIKDIREAAEKSLYTIYTVMEGLDNQPEELLKLKNNLILAGTLESEAEKSRNALTLSTERLISNLDSDNLNLRKRSAEQLGQRTVSEARQPLKQLLGNTDEDPDLRAIVAEALGKLAENENIIDKIMVSALIKALDHDQESDRYVREKAAFALRQLKTKESIDALNKAAREDVISSVRTCAQEALEDIAQNAIEEVQRQLATYYLRLIRREPEDNNNDSQDSSSLIYTLENDSEIENKRKAALLLGQFKNRAVVKALINEGLSSNNPDVCAAAADALGQIGQSTAMSPLISKLEELETGDRIAREAIVKALGQLKVTTDDLNKAKVINILIDRWRNDPISTVRGSIELAIREIYKNSRHPDAEQALRRYPNYNDYETDRLYKQFFQEFPPNTKN